MKRTDVFLSLGTNMGDRDDNIRRALELLDDAFGSNFKAISSIVRTEAVGFDGPDFLNCVVLYELEMEPEKVLDKCKDVEGRMGRTDAPEYDTNGCRIYHDRIIDVDILLYGDLEINTERLTIPHPQLPKRPFFKLLIEEIRQFENNC